MLFAESQVLRPNTRKYSRMRQTRLNPLNGQTKAGGWELGCEIEISHVADWYELDSSLIEWLVVHDNTADRTEEFNTVGDKGGKAIETAGNHSRVWSRNLHLHLLDIATREVWLSQEHCIGFADSLLVNIYLLADILSHEERAQPLLLSFNNWPGRSLNAN